MIWFFFHFGLKLPLLNTEVNNFLFTIVKHENQFCFGDLYQTKIEIVYTYAYTKIHNI